MSRLTPLVTGVLAVLLAGCATASVDQPTPSGSIAATSSPSLEPVSPSASPSQAPTAPGGVAPSPPTDVTAKTDGPGKPGTMFTVNATWTPAAPTDAYRIYKYETGEGPEYGKCVFDKAKAALLAESQPGATSAVISLDSAVTGAGVRCLYVVAVNDAGESSPMLAWRSSE